MFEILQEYAAAFAGGLATTLMLFGIVSVAGLGVGVPAGILVYRAGVFAQIGFKWILVLLTSVPALVVLYWFYYPLPRLTGVELTPFWTAATALSVINAASVMDLIASRLRAFPRALDDLRVASGVSEGFFSRKVRLPYVALHSLPAYLLICVVTLHATLFAGLISVGELFRVAQRVNAVEYRPIEIYTGMAIFFVVTCVPLRLIAEWTERSVANRFGERTAT